MTHRHFISAFVFLVLASTIHTSKAQGVLWPVEIYQGGTFIEGVDPYSFSLRLQPTLGTNEFQYGPTLAFAYTNPKWAGQFGVQTSFKVGGWAFSGVDAALIHLGIEGLWEIDGFLGNQNRGMIGPKIKLDVGAIQLGVRTNYDYINKAWGLGGWIGFGLKTLFFSDKERDPVSATEN